MISINIAGKVIVPNYNSTLDKYRSLLYIIITQYLNVVMLRKDGDLYE